MSLAPWIVAWPRIAMTPPPGRPMLPSSSWRIAPARIICTPSECCVQPTAQQRAAVRSGPVMAVSALAPRVGDQDLGDLLELGARDAAHALDHLGRVAAVVALDDLKDAARVLQ